MALSIAAPVGYGASSCGYCTPPGSGERSEGDTSCSYGIWAYQLRPEHYQALVDRGWRRSGAYVYKPDNARTCCPQHSIRLPANRFRLGKTARRALSRIFWDLSGRSKPAKWKGKWGAQPADLEQRVGLVMCDRPDSGLGAVARAPYGSVPDKRIETILVPASSTKEKYNLFRRYQTQVHGEAEDDISGRKGWERFLVDNPIRDSEQRGPVSLSDRKPIPYGTYHQEYYFEGRIIAVGVLDILPACVSSVYLFYDPDYAHWELGKVSVLREILLVQQLQRKGSLQSLQYYYMGYYIHSCQKMRYKGAYHPSELLDAADNQWYSLAKVTPLLDSGARYGFGAASRQKENGASEEKVHRNALPRPADDEEDALPRPPPPGIQAPEAFARHADECLVLLMRSDAPGLCPLSLLTPGPPRTHALEGFAALGRPLCQQVALVL